MLSGSRGDFSGVGDIHFFYSSDEVLYGALPDFEGSMRPGNVPCTAFARPGMVTATACCRFSGRRRRIFAKIAEFLKQ